MVKQNYFYLKKLLGEKKKLKKKKKREREKFNHKKLL